ncbi:small-conductance mechanosensitive channel [Litorivivens lipolytica]|uniref:Small-conductance mechanosensitive channel n=1 Tax=Litorivivens lipolytica TaxID=1524264 RepID=A0A7W4Z4R1_9GAMM|nr:mechanosensitive ion channel family protein [Litorivivens lipolytica]MBB3046744.1 small-conductance mechanosensitive channel [Litorivivens lipolytica]
MLDNVDLTQEQVALLAPLAQLMISTVLLVLAILVLRSVSARFILKNVTTTELRTKWLVQSRNALALLLILGLILIWGEELRTVALSVVAIAVALVVATKELILCLIGSMLKAGTSSFDIGDRIQIKEYRGDVIDHNPLTTTLLEVGPGKVSNQLTGRVLTIPNALFVSDAVVNETPNAKYLFHVISIPFRRDHDWQGAKAAMLEAAKREVSAFAEEARRYLVRFSTQRGLEPPSVEPRVTIQVPAPEEIHLIMRLPVPSTRRVAIEQAILSAVMEGNFSVRKELPVNGQPKP